MQSISVVIPVYNSAENLAELYERLRKVLEKEARDFEVILVDDGSEDRSWEEIERLSCQSDQIKGIRLARNFGQHNALLCGIRAGRYDLIVTLDDDLQNPPEEIPRLLQKLAEGYDVVYGYPQAERHGPLRRLASQLTKLVLEKAMGAATARHCSSFRGFRTQLREAFANYRASFISVDVLLTWGTGRFAAIAVRHDPRRRGRSQYTLAKLLKHAINMLTGFTTLPLQLASLLGFGLTFFGIVVLVYVVGRYLIQGSVVRGFPFLASIISIFSGAQLFALGIIGEYLARMHFRAMEKPPFVIRSVAMKGEEAKDSPPLAGGVRGGGE